METNGYTKKTRHSISYPNLPSAILPAPHSQLYPVPFFGEQSPLQGVSFQVSEESPGNDTELSYNQIQICNQIDVGTDSSCMSLESDSDYSKELPSYVSQSVLQTMNQSELNDQIRDSNLPKKSSYYKSKESSFRKFFDIKDSFVFCANVNGLLLKLGIRHSDVCEWRLFIDSSKRSLKFILLHNGNILGSIPMAHSVHAKEAYSEIKLSLLDYQKHGWVICMDTKIVNFLLGQQGGYTKYPCFLCYWDSRARDKHWSQKDWPVREHLQVGGKI